MKILRSKEQLIQEICREISRTWLIPNWPDHYIKNKIKLEEIYNKKITNTIVNSTNYKKCKWVELEFNNSEKLKIWL